MEVQADSTGISSAVIHTDTSRRRAAYSGGESRPTGCVRMTSYAFRHRRHTQRGLLVRMRTAGRLLAAEAVLVWFASAALAQTCGVASLFDVCELVGRDLSKEQR